ncbi:MAG: putative zinc-binding metallopeptidase [Syntrophothermus sp.]|nr:putative zinc-binding metallopeptidase [Ignavibacteriaceae bacterium]
MKKNTLNRMSAEELLNLKLKNLRLSIKGSNMEKRISRLYYELEKKGLFFKPHIWISEEWFTPDDIAGFAIPFYLFHPVLLKLEKEQVFEAEGAELSECLKIMRHETGHAISHAYQLYKLKEWKKIFGDYREPYPLWYTPEIKSKDYVTHLNAWYAQAHPLEDFAETFAVWLNPKSNWKKQYENWPAFEKLNYLDALMNDIKDREPIIKTKEEYAQLSKSKRTIGDYYKRKKKFYTVKWAQSFDEELKKIFTITENKNSLSAERFLKSVRKNIRKNISEVLDIPQYTIDQLIRELIIRSIKLNLQLKLKKEEAFEKLIIIITAQLINLIHTGYYRIPL